MRRLKVVSLSFSKVKQYTEMCPMAIKYEVDKIPIEEKYSANLIFGSAIHQVCDAWARSLLLGKELSLEVLKKVFKSRFNQVPDEYIQFGAKDREALFAMADIMIQLLLDSEWPYQILGVEVPISYQLTDSLGVVGKADLIFRDKEGALNVIDFKAAAKKYGSQELYSVAEQCALYSWAFDEKVKTGVAVCHREDDSRSPIAFPDHGQGVFSL